MTREPTVKKNSGGNNDDENVENLNNAMAVEFLDDVFDSEDEE